MKTYWGSGVTASCPSPFTPEERVPGTHWIGGWVSGSQSQSGHNGEEKKNPFPARNRTSATEPVA